MAEGLNGMNKRVKDTVGEECYLTPPWAVRWLLERWEPSGAVVCDPCACGYGGWSIGGQVVLGDGWDRDAGGRLELYDLTPRHLRVHRADFRELFLPPTKGGRTIITNPPYNLLSEFVSWALSQAEEVVILTRFGFLCAEQGKRARHLAEYLQPARRLAFELLPEEGRRRIVHNAVREQLLAAGSPMTKGEQERLDVHRDPRCLTGYRMSSAGVDHGWAVYRRGHEGPARLVIEAAEENTKNTGGEMCPW